MSAAARKRIGDCPQGSWTSLLRGGVLPPNIFQRDIYEHFAILLNGRYDDPAKLRARANVVITFNYDLVLDNALRQSNVDPDYGLEETSAQTSEENGAQIPLLKLHGSTNWAICPACKRVDVMKDAKFTNDPLAFRMRPCSGCRKTGLRLLLVPPIWNKSEYRETMRPIWRKAVDALKSAKRICIIGYSMPETDTFFKFLLTLGLAENHQLFQFVVVDSIQSSGKLPTGRNKIEQRYRDMLEGVFESRRFRFFGEGFANFLNDGGSSAAIGRAETIVTQGIS